MTTKTIYDTVHVTVVDTIHRVIADSVTLEALKNSQVFYNDAYGHLEAILLSALGGVAILFGIKLFLDHAKVNSMIKAEAEKLRKEMNTKYREANVPIVQSYLLSGHQLEKSKRQADAFHQFYFALMLCQELPIAKLSLSILAMNGVKENWLNVGAQGRHPALQALDAFVKYCAESKDADAILIYADKAREIRGEMETEAEGMFAMPLDGAKIFSGKDPK